jgi:hypothetical protein
MRNGLAIIMSSLISNKNLSRAEWFLVFDKLLISLNFIDIFFCLVRQNALMKIKCGKKQLRAVKIFSSGLLCEFSFCLLGLK